MEYKEWRIEERMSDIGPPTLVYHVLRKKTIVRKYQGSYEVWVTENRHITLQAATNFVEHKLRTT